MVPSDSTYWLAWNIEAPGHPAKITAEQYQSKVEAVEARSPDGVTSVNGVAHLDDWRVVPFTEDAARRQRSLR